MAQAYMDTGLVHLSFNRYMVECEFFSPAIKMIELAGFNRYMVECEFSQRKGLPAWTRTVLIDTWWNVNYGKR